MSKSYKVQVSIILTPLESKSILTAALIEIDLVLFVSVFQFDGLFNTLFCFLDYF